MGKIEIHYTLNGTFFKNLRIFEAEDFTCTKFQNVTFTLPEFAFGNPLIQTPCFFYFSLFPSQNVGSPYPKETVIPLRVVVIFREEIFMRNCTQISEKGFVALPPIFVYCILKGGK